MKRSLQKNQRKNKQTVGTPTFCRYIEFYEVLEYRGVMKIPEFQQVGDDNRESETNCNDESPMVEEEMEDLEIKQNTRIMIKFLSYSDSKFLGAPL